MWVSSLPVIFSRGNFFKFILLEKFFLQKTISFGLVDKICLSVICSQFFCDKITCTQGYTKIEIMQQVSLTVK